MTNNNRTAVIVNSSASADYEDALFESCRVAKGLEGGTRWVCDSELIELARALGAPMVELFPARVQGVLRGRK